MVQSEARKGVVGVRVRGGVMEFTQAREVQRDVVGSCVLPRNTQQHMQDDREDVDKQHDLGGSTGGVSQ